MIRLIAFLLLLAFCLAGCRVAPPPTGATPTVDALATIVAATLSAVPSPLLPTPSSTEQTAPPTTTTATPTKTATPTSSPTSQVATVSGLVCYRSRDIPAMTAYFQETGSQGVIELPISAGQTSYQVTLPPGTYIAYAWVIDFSLGGLYSEAVPCGLRATCSDHKPISFTVDGINNVEGIDLCDWYAFGVPEPVGKPALDIKGAISGQIIHPDGSPPELRVVAFNQTSGYWYWVKTLSGQVDYSIPSLPPGVYHLVAYPDVGQAGGHADAGHKLLDVQVKAGETAAGVSIADWNAPSGAFPPDPTR